MSGLTDEKLTQDLRQSLPNMHDLKSEIKTESDVNEAKSNSCSGYAAQPSATPAVTAHHQTMDQSGDGKNPISELNELAAIRNLPTPIFQEVGDEGPPHQRKFTIRVTIGAVTADGTGSQKKIAKAAAAASALKELLAVLPPQSRLSKRSSNTHRPRQILVPRNPPPVVDPNPALPDEGLSNVMTMLAKLNYNDKIKIANFLLENADAFIAEVSPQSKVESSSSSSSPIHGKQEQQTAPNSIHGAASPDTIGPIHPSPLATVASPSKVQPVNTLIQTANPIGELQELCVKHGLQPAIYTEVLAEGPPHARRFVMRVAAAGFSTEAEGLSKKVAKTEAARKLLSMVMSNGSSH